MRRICLSTTLIMSIPLLAGCASAAPGAQCRDGSIPDQPISKAAAIEKLIVLVEHERDFGTDVEDSARRFSRSKLHKGCCTVSTRGDGHDESFYRLTSYSYYMPMIMWFDGKVDYTSYGSKAALLDKCGNLVEDMFDSSSNY
jgi:hypothetical protein